MTFQVINAVKPRSNMNTQMLRDGRSPAFVFCFLKHAIVTCCAFESQRNAQFTKDREVIHYFSIVSVTNEPDGCKVAYCFKMLYHRTCIY